MTVQFILGRSGTGKTTYCVRAIVEALLSDSDQPLVLLVPEQATFQAERAVLADDRVAGYDRLHVVSFERLQFLLLGSRTAKAQLSRVGRQMVVHRIIAECRDRLTVFRSSVARPGLARRVAQTIAELHQYAKTHLELGTLLAKLAQERPEDLTALKFADIRLILQQYTDFIAGRFVDPDLQLAAALGAVCRAPMLRGAKLWVDGFATFTAGELRLLAEVLKTVEDAHVALCIDPVEAEQLARGGQDIQPTDLFHPTKRTYAALLKQIRTDGLDLAKPVVLDQPRRFAASPALAHLEAHLFEQAGYTASAGRNIRVVAAPDARSEVMFVAKQIALLVRNAGFRYRDVAVIAPDVTAYEHYVRACFAEFDIPYFLDAPKPLEQHPVAQMLCEALKLATGDFSRADIFAYLKTDLVPIPRQDVDLLENYCIAYGVTQSDWQSAEPWCFAGEPCEMFDQRRIDRIRTEAIWPVLKLRDALAGAPDEPIGPVGFTDAVFEFLDGLGVRETLARWIDQALADGDLTAADEHRQFFDRLVDVFDELTDAFAGCAISPGDCLLILQSALSRLHMAFIPPALDQVLVGSIERSRHPDLKAVFLVGTTQKHFPSPIGPAGVLSDADRATADAFGFHLAPGSTDALAERRYLAYIAMTRPAQLLCVTYPAVDEKGGALARSHFIDELEALFDDLQPAYIENDLESIDQIHCRNELAGLLCAGLGKDVFSPAGCDQNILADLWRDVCADPNLSDLGRVVTDALIYDNRAELDAETATALFPGDLAGSATRLSTFAACPYRHFAKHVLDLRLRPQFKFEPLELGDFYHRVLDGLARDLKSKQKDWATIDNTELLEILHSRIESVVAGDPLLRTFVHRATHNAFIIESAAEVLDDCVTEIAQMIRAGRFRPALSEAAFGESSHVGTPIGTYQFDLRDGRRLSLSGKIDRIDVADLDQEKVAVIFDYKRSAKRAWFSWSNFYHGIDLQLPIYMLATDHIAPAQISKVVGAFYIPVEPGVKKAERAFKRKAKGFLNGDYFAYFDGQTTSGWSPFVSVRVTEKGGQYSDFGRSAALKAHDFERLHTFAERKIVELARRILSGTIDVQPYRLGTSSPCGHCEYRAVCRFDWQINDYNDLPGVNKQQILDRIAQEL